MYGCRNKRHSGITAYIVCVWTFSSIRDELLLVSWNVCCISCTTCWARSLCLAALYVYTILYIYKTARPGYRVASCLCVCVCSLYAAAAEDLLYCRHNIAHKLLYYLLSLLHQFWSRLRPPSNLDILAYTFYSMGLVGLYIFPFRKVYSWA